jgi:hypothetical protein
VGTIVLPRCTTLTLEVEPLLNNNPSCFLTPIFTQLKPDALIFSNPISGGALNSPYALNSKWVYGHATGQLGLPQQHWSHTLRKVHFDDVLLFSENPHGHENMLVQVRRFVLILSEISSRRMSSEPREGSYRTLKVALFGGDRALFGEDMENTLHSGRGAFSGWGRVELRVSARAERIVRDHYESGMPPDWRCTDEDKAFRSKIVFVDENGQERGLVKE